MEDGGRAGWHRAPVGPPWRRPALLSACPTETGLAWLGRASRVMGALGTPPRQQPERRRVPKRKASHTSSTLRTTEHSFKKSVDGANESPHTVATGNLLSCQLTAVSGAAPSDFPFASDARS